MNLVKTAILWGASWKFRLSNLDDDTLGDCDWDKKTIRIRNRDLKDKLLLDTIIHEAIHACCPWLVEFAVQLIATDITRLIWRLGYRLPEEVTDVNSDQT